MRELSLNILDITENSLSAGAKNVSIEIDEAPDGIFTLTITDDGCGMSKEMVESVIDPFCTTRKTRKVGLGIPLLKLAAEQTGGSLSIESKPEAEYPESHGTVVRAVFRSDSIDFTPLGDIASTLVVLIQGSPDVDFIFRHTAPSGEVFLSTSQMREVLGNDVSLSDFSVLKWIKDYIAESYANLKK